jgi:carboxymethylenebutenolidase
VAIKEEWIRYGDQLGYFAIPERGARPLPSVLVIQEIYGVNRQIRDVTRRIAAAGYAALAPDLFAQGGERPEALAEERVDEAMAFGQSLPPGGLFDPAAREAALARLPEDRRGRLGETLAAVSAVPRALPSLVAPLRRALRYLREERPETSGKRTGCVGFCMGGGLSTLLACEESELSAAAVYYGQSPASEKAAAIRCPVLGFYGGKDQRVNAGIPDFERAMKAAGKSYEYRIYEGAGHAFFNDDSPAYHVDAARDSFARLLSFFAANLAT